MLAMCSVVPAPDVLACSECDEYLWDVLSTQGHWISDVGDTFAVLVVVPSNAAHVRVHPDGGCSFCKGTGTL